MNIASVRSLYRTRSARPPAERMRCSGMTTIFEEIYMRKQEWAFAVILVVTALGIWQYEKHEDRKRAESAAAAEQTTAQPGKAAPK